MANYSVELVPPAYRNLVMNPGGEVAPASTWLASNGVTSTGNTDVTPASGIGVVRYQVTSATSQSYYFGPLGPDEAVTHKLAFKIPVSRTLTYRVKVRADRTVWVRVHASWLAGGSSFASASATTLDAQVPNTVAVQGLDAQAPASNDLVEVGRTAVGSGPVSIGTSGWTTLDITVTAAEILSGVSHWRPLIAVYSANPTTDPAPPVLGTRVFADEALILDNGGSTSGVAFFDGNTAGHVWEDTPFYSASRTTPPAPDLPPDIDPGEQPENPDDIPDPTDPNDPGDVDEIPDSGGPTPDPPKELTPQQALNAKAERIVGTRVEPRNLCMVGDFQLENLMFNTVDEDDVTWIVSDVEGWWTTPEPDVPDVARAFFDGSFPTRGRYTARTFTIAGSFFPRYQDTVSRARDRLIRALNLCHKGGWFMAHEDTTQARSNTKGSQVWLAGQPLIQTVNTNGRTDFSIALRAPDSLKYGIKDGVPPGFNEQTIVTSNVQYPERAYPRTYPWQYPEAVYGVTDGFCENVGNAYVYPIFRLAGPTAGPLRIYNVATDQEMRIVRKLYAGEVLQIDTATKQVTLNGTGNFRFYVDVDTNWLSLAPGSNRIKFSEEELTDLRAELTILWRSGWIG